jgi:hypothetical protein
MKKLIFIFITALLFNLNSCTDEFETLNKNPYQITDESLGQDFNNVGAFYAPMLYNLIGDQIEENLSHASWVRHEATPTPFLGNTNNTHYVPSWGYSRYWNRYYNNVMAPSNKVLKIAEAEGYPVFVAWAKLIRVAAMSRLTALLGPVIYTEFGTAGAGYDSEPELYNALFADLDEIAAVFGSNLDYNGLKSFDTSGYGGSVEGWLKFTNSLRLRLAMRISKVNASLSKQQAEKAINNPGGLIVSNSDNLMLSNNGRRFLPARVGLGWGDAKMSATMESVLIGYEDPRLEIYFQPVSDASLVTDHPDHPYKGVRAGAVLVAKGDRLPYSDLGAVLDTWTDRHFMTSAEIHLALAEASLRGYNTGGTAAGFYQSGVEQSFAYWGAGGAAGYLQNDTGLPLDYDDPKAEGPINDFVSRITNTVKWDEGASDEIKLEKIITQKWINTYMDSMEAWVDHRRTGYPKIPYNYRNMSNSTFGIIGPEDFLKRFVYPGSQVANNAAAYAEAVGFLGGDGDKISTRLWWDTGGSNF